MEAGAHNLNIDIEVTHTRSSANMFYTSSARRLFSSRGNHESTHYNHVRDDTRGFVSVETNFKRFGGFNVLKNALHVQY